MENLSIRPLILEDENPFLSAMQRSQTFLHPWVKVPLTKEEFDDYLQRSQQPNQKSYIIHDDSSNIIGVINLNEIIHGLFQNAYLGYYVVADYAGQGYMSAAMKLVINQAFTELGLHRLEANIQPENIASINLVKHNGFRKEGYSPHYLCINDVWCDHERWAITVEDWLQQKSS